MIAAFRAAGCFTSDLPMNKACKSKMETWNAHRNFAVKPPTPKSGNCMRGMQVAASYHLISGSKSKIRHTEKLMVRCATHKTLIAS
jgi:hypothetical protein